MYPTVGSRSCFPVLLYGGSGYPTVRTPSLWDIDGWISINPFSESEQKIICRPSDSTTIHWHGSIRRDPTVRSCVFACFHFGPSDQPDPTVRYAVPCCVRFLASFCVLCITRLCSCGIWFCCENRSFADSSLRFKAMMPVSCSISLCFSIIFVFLFLVLVFWATYKSSKAFVDMLGLIVRFVVVMKDALRKLDR